MIQVSTLFLLVSRRAKLSKWGNASRGINISNCSKLWAPNCRGSVASHMDRGADSMTEASDELAEDAAYAAEQLNMIKARTMYNMVEDLDDNKRLLFLTNAQADLIAKNPAALQKMLDVLDVGKPSLVINLLPSSGFSITNRCLPEDVKELTRTGWLGMVSDKGAFLDEEEESDAIFKIDMFMADAIIPLAARTNAIVICSAPGALR